MKLIKISIFFIISEFFFCVFDHLSKFYFLIDGSKFFLDVMLYLFSIQILKISLQSLPLRSIDVNENNIYFYNFIASFAFGLATPSLIKSIFTSANSSWLNRWVCISMFFSPTTIASAYIFNNIHPHVLTLIIYGVLLFPMMLLAFPIQITFNIQVLILMLISVANICLAYTIHALLNINFLVVQAIIFCVVSIFIIIRQQVNLLKYRKIIFYESLDNCLFFISMGILVFIIKYSSLSSLIHALTINNIYLCLLFIMLVVPLMTIFFLHPLMLYSLLSPSLYVILTHRFNDTQIYIIWVTSFIVSQLCSPSSVSTILAANIENTSIWKVSVFRHITFCIKMLLIILLFLFLSTFIRL